MPISSVLINFILFMGLGLIVKKNQILARIIEKIIYGGIIASLVWMVVTAIGYLYTPLFFDHAEASISSVAAYWRWGHPIYTESGDPHRYSLLYGPWPYLVAALMQCLGSETILLSKVSGFINFVLVYLISFLLARPLKISSFSKFLMMASVSLIFAGFYNFGYWVRPDSYLTAYAFLGLYVAKAVSSKGRWFPYVFIGILAAFAANCKAHGFIYLIPPAIYYLELNKQRVSGRGLLLGLISFSVFFFIPFLLPGVSFTNYIGWLESASQHGLQIEEFLKNITYILSFLLLLWMIGFQREYRYTFIAFCLTGLLTSIIGSKAGAGLNHLMPFLAVILWLAMEKFFTSPLQEQKRMSYIAGAFVLTLTLNGVNRQKRVKVLLSETSERRAEYADLKSLSEKYGPMELGYSSLEAYLSTTYKAYLVDKGSSLLLDGASLMDMEASEMTLPDRTLQSLKDCKIQKFILPISGEPWSISSYYSQKSLFPEEFKAIFDAKYILVERSQFFRVYDCKL